MYLVVGKNKAALIDTGMGIGDLKKLVLGLTRLPVTVLLTHGHIDHAMAAWRFNDVYMSERDDSLYREHSDWNYRCRFMKNNAPALSQYLDKVMDMHYHNLKDKDILNLGGVSIEAFECPGHTQGSFVFLLKEDRILILGDSCNANTLIYDEHSTSIEQYKKSLEKLDDETKGLYDHTLFSHESPMKGTDMISEMIELCDKVMNHKDDGQKITVFGDEACRAVEIRPDGYPVTGEVNLVYSPDRIFENLLEENH